MDGGRRRTSVAESASIADGPSCKASRRCIRRRRPRAKELHLRPLERALAAGANLVQAASEISESQTARPRSTITPRGSAFDIADAFRWSWYDARVVAISDSTATPAGTFRSIEPPIMSTSITVRMDSKAAAKLSSVEPIRRVSSTEAGTVHVPLRLIEPDVWRRRSGVGSVMTDLLRRSLVLDAGVDRDPAGALAGWRCHRSRRTRGRRSGSKVQPRPHTERMNPLVNGLAVAWRPAIAALLEEYAAAGRLGFTEVVAENLRADRLPPALTRLGVPVLVHGVTLGLAGAERPDPARLSRLADLAGALGSPLVSEHAAFVRAAASPDPLHGDVLEAGHLLPPPRTRASLDVLVENVRIAQDQLPVPLALENIAALFGWPEDTIDEPDFLTELVGRTGCRLVLDVANLYSSALAHGSDPAAELRRFPLEAVAYVHVAGGEYRRVDGAELYLDTHAHPMVPPVLGLLAELAGSYVSGALPGIMLERDEDVSPVTVAPEFEALSGAVAQAVARCPA